MLNIEDKQGYKYTEEFGYVPNNWKVVRVSDKSDVKTGGTPSTSIPEYWNGNVRWMSSGELNNKRIYDVEGRITELGLNHSSATLIPSNCILIGLAGQGKTRGTAAINYVELSTNQSIAAILPSKHFNSEYLYQSIDKRYEELRELSSGGGGRGGLNKAILMNLPILLPPIPEQEKIAEVLGDVDSLIDKTQQLINKKKDLKTATMQKLLTPRQDWEEKKLGDICSYITTGKLDANAMVVNGEYRFYTCAKEYYKIDTYAFEGESLLVSGNGANVGYIHYYNGKFNAYQRTYVLQKFSENIFYIKCFMDKFLSDRIASEVNAGNTPYIKLDTITDMLIKYPKNNEEQEKIATILSDMDSEIEAWGTCNVDKQSACFNLELAKKQTKEIEYVILHELSHLVEKTHNQKFVAHVESYMPNWKLYRKELNSLTFE